jgi:SAM-dependent methyltransferase
MEPACIYPFKDNSFDGISCLAVLEHVEEPWTVAKELRRMLKPGGKVFIDWPFLQPVHGYPSHFYNATREGLARMFRDGFELVKIDTFPNQTPDHTLAWILRELVGSIASHEIKEELLAASVGDLLRTPPGEGIWSRVTASVSEKTLMGLACGNTLIAKKRM